MIVNKDNLSFQTSRNLDVDRTVYLADYTTKQLASASFLRKELAKYKAAYETAMRSSRKLASELNKTRN